MNESSLRFRMRPQDDLSTRADFTRDLLTEVGEQIKSAISEDPALAGAEVDVKGSLTNVILDVRVPGADEAKRKEVSERVNAALKDKMGDILQNAIDRARSRM